MTAIAAIDAMAQQAIAPSTTPVLWITRHRDDTPGTRPTVHYSAEEAAQHLAQFREGVARTVALVEAGVPSAEPAAKWCAIHQHYKPCEHTRETAQPPAALHTAVRLVLEATPEQLPLALDALRDMMPNVVLTGLP